MKQEELIKAKREDLGRFVQEQIIGPGISGYRFLDLKDDALLLKNLLEQRALENNKEIINIVPAGVYSTGILFPAEKLNDGFDLTNFYEKDASETDSDESEGTTKLNDESSIDEDDSIHIDQMFPNTMGLTCCLNQKSLVHSDIQIKVLARYYKKINRKEDGFHDNYGILCECDVNVLKTILADTGLEQSVRIKKMGPNTILTISALKNEQLTETKKLLRDIIERKCGDFAELLREFNLPFNPKSLSANKQSCYYELRNKCNDKEKKARLYLLTQEIEAVENSISHLNDLLEINDSRSYGLWRCEQISIPVSIPEEIPTHIRGRKIYHYNKYPSLKNIYINELGPNEYASLSINLQFNQDSRSNDDKIFLKVQLINTSTPFIPQEDDSRYYSVFNEVVNQRAFFGVKIKIMSKCLIPYNINHLNEEKDFYDDDEVTKFIYRQFRDYGVGHNCSVSWSNNNDDTISIETQYIPIYDVPNIEPIPKDKTNIIKNNSYYEPERFIISSHFLEFKWLSIFSDVKNDSIIKGLSEFVNSYEKWINMKKEEYEKNAKVSTRKIALQELRKCENDKERMRRNIQIFLEGEKNEAKLGAFRLMNAAMFMQLWHSVNVKNNRVQNFLNDENFIGFDHQFYINANDELFQKGSHAAWRPFQLAFILLNLDGIFKDDDDPEWVMRNEWVDLVWFPTGGGKTEAYLGIIALTIINRRRLYGDKGGGTAVIMRYTLRLLTLQQFQRATLLIMALELLRRWDVRDLGSEPIYIGLWVGQDSLPNRMLPSSNEDKNNLLTEFNKVTNGRPSKIPFTQCPWCASKLLPAEDMERDNSNVHQHRRLHLRCSNSNCSFYYSRPARARPDQGPIPTSLCDEEIYQHPPALLFGTVDKFAQLAHKASDNTQDRHKDSRRIFGKGNWENGKPSDGYLPPDLIIQDELHLLLGPLGTAVGLFESAIDQLCTREKGTRPKVISSTATTRNTELQIMALFDRRVNLFPKPGVECDDSFFAFYSRRYDLPGSTTEYLSNRRYVGLLPTGRTQIWMQMRIAAILMTHRAIFEMQHLNDNTPLDFEHYKNFEKVMDYYHTIISYFNSLKEVGKTESQIQTYILKEIRRVFNRVIRPNKLMHSLYTYNIHKGELTGRLSGEEVKNELDKVSSNWKAENRLDYKSNDIDVRMTRKVPPDFIVATNMISVGIDVSRFNNLIMNSMPRNIAEYIQATSRVARDSYGIVFTLHHPFRARDISHYEKFIEFHEKMYSYVEPISITPFTSKAINRYLGLYLATMLRHRTRFVNRESANDMIDLHDDEIKKLCYQLSDYFEKRHMRLSQSSVDELIKNLLKSEDLDKIKSWIQEAIQEWLDFNKELSTDLKHLVFNNKSNKKTPATPQEQLYVEIEEYEENIHSVKWQIPMSLRVIEPEAALKIKQK